MKIIQPANRPAFDVFTTGQLDTLLKACQTVEPRLYISIMDYNTGKIHLGMHYDQFDEESFITVNVAADSVASAFYDVYTRVYERCI